MEAVVHTFKTFFSGNQRCQQLKSPKPQHFHEFFTQKESAIFFWKSNLNFWTKNEDFEQCVLLTSQIEELIHGHRTSFCLSFDSCRFIALRLPHVEFLVLIDQLNNSTDDESILVGSRLLSNAFLAGC